MNYMILDDRIMMVLERTETHICPPCIQTLHPQRLAQLPAVPEGLCPPRPQNKSTKLGGLAVYPSWLTADQWSIRNPFAFNTWFDHMQPFLTNVWMCVNVAAWWWECSPWWLSQFDKLKIHESTKTSHRCKRANARLQIHAFLTEKGLLF